MQNIGWSGEFAVISEDVTDEKHESSEICDSVNRKFEMNPEMLITKLSFTYAKHIL